MYEQHHDMTDNTFISTEKLKICKTGLTQKYNTSLRNGRKRKCYWIQTLPVSTHTKKIELELDPLHNSNATKGNITKPWVNPPFVWVH